MSQSSMWTGTQPLFTAAQWQELEHQAHIFKYIKAGMPVPPDLLAPIQKGFHLMSTKLVHHPTLGYGSYYGKKIDPEPGRCRRTDGKKWRCSKEAHPDSKYCERHMNRRRYRSRKPVESQTASQTLSSRSPSDNAAGSRSGCGSFHSLPLHSTGSGETLSLGNNMSQLQMAMGPPSDSVAKKEYRSEQKLDADKHFSQEGFQNARFRQAEVESHIFFQDGSENARHHGVLRTSESLWPDISHISSNSLAESRTASFMAGNCFQLQTNQEVEHLKVNAATSNQPVFNIELGMARFAQPTQDLFSEWHRKTDFSRTANDDEPHRDSVHNSDVNVDWGGSFLMARQK